jgi:hypothetical protein
VQFFINFRVTPETLWQYTGCRRCLDHDTDVGGEHLHASAALPPVFIVLSVYPRAGLGMEAKRDDIAPAGK